MINNIFLTFLLIIISINISQSQTYDPYIQNYVDEVSLDSLYTNLQNLESLGIKELNTVALDSTGEWLIKKYESFGYTDIVTDTFIYSGYSAYNIIVTKQGTIYPNKYLIIDGHYDTKNGPGVNDNGSGVAIILEIARIIQSIETAYSIKFINFSAEEYGLIGSSHYVINTVNPEQMDIRLVFNIDEVGGVAGMVNDIIICERDESPPSNNNQESWAFTDTLVNLTDIYSTLEPEISYAYGSDYVPFQNNGEIITGLFEYNYTPYAHTINDSLVNLDTDYVYEIAKLSVAAGIYFAGVVNTSTNDNPAILPTENIKIFPVPFSDELSVSIPGYLNTLKIILTDGLGRNFTYILSKSKYTFNTQDLNPGIYLYHIQNGNGQTIQKGKLIKRN